MTKPLTALRDALLTDDFTNPANLPHEGKSVLVDPILAEVMASGHQPPATNHQFTVAETEEQEAKLSDARRAAEAFDYVACPGPGRGR